MSTYEFQPGDYIVFTRTIQPARDVRHRTDYKTGRPIVVPAIPEQVLPQGGEGQIIRVLSAPRKVDGKVYQAARVQCAKHLGVQTVVLDDATLAAKPLTMDLGIEAVDPQTHGPSIYSSDAKGIA